MVLLDMTSWYVLRIKPRYERIAAQQLNLKGFESFFATYTQRKKWSDRVKTFDVQLFPGYIFCRCAWEERVAILRTPGVMSIVTFGNIPAAVPEDEIDAVRAIVASGLPARPWPYLQKGDRVTIDRGCLAG